MGVHFRVHFPYVNGHSPYAAAAQEAAGEQKEKGGVPGLNLGVHFPYAAAAQEAAGEQKEKGGSPARNWGFISGFISPMPRRSTGVHFPAPAARRPASKKGKKSGSPGALEKVFISIVWKINIFHPPGKHVHFHIFIFQATGRNKK